MACNLAAHCNFLFGFFSCTLPEDTIDVNLMVHTLWEIHMFKKVRNTQVIKFIPWGTKVKPFPSLQSKITEYLRQREAFTNPFANRSYQSRPKAYTSKKPSHCQPFYQQVKPFQTYGYTYKKTQASIPYQTPHRQNL